MDPELVDRIYECSLVPEFWPGVLDTLAEIAGARGGLLLAISTGLLNWTASVNLRDIFSRYIIDGWAERCPRRARWFSLHHPSFLVESDVWSAEELESIPAYRDFLRPRGLGWSASTAIPLPTGDNLLFGLERDYARGPVDRAAIQNLDELRPHLARSALLSARLRLERARMASETLAALGLPARHSVRT